MHPYLYDVIAAAIWMAVVIALMFRWSNDAPDPSDPHRTPKRTMGRKDYFRG